MRASAAGWRLLGPVLLATVLYALQTRCLGGWIVDDAGISFSYARSLAAGDGLVSQPGVEPVEGYTNLLWVLLLAVFMKLSLFDPVWTPKILGGICAAASLALVGHAMAAPGRRPVWLVAAALSTTAVLPGFAIWTASGLENGLYALTVAVLAAVCLREDGTVGPRVPSSVAAGIALFLVFCTRPDGAVYFWIYPFLRGVSLGPRRWRRPVGLYVATFVGLWLALTVFRLAYYQDVLPNTFYAKRGEGAAYFAWLIRELPLAAAGTVVALTGALAILGIGAGAAAGGARLHSRIPVPSVRDFVPAIFLLGAVLAYHALRGDWMPEYRFATPAFLFGPAAVLGMSWDALSRWPRTRARGLAVVSLALVVGVGVRSRQRVEDFAAAPALSFGDVRELSIRIADSVEPIGRRIVVMTPDIGGALWENRFEVLDLMGLIDRQLARAEFRDRERLRIHVLRERKPEAVWHHGAWMHRAGLAGDPEFEERYVPVWEERASPEGPVQAGLYVVRELAE